MKIPADNKREIWIIQLGVMNTALIFYMDYFENANRLHLQENSLADRRHKKDSQ